MQQTAHTHHRQPCPDCQHDPTDGDCATPFTERNRYFDGKLMVARDFSDEQRYLRSLSMTHNRYLHDWGIVCGYETECHPDPACRPNWIVIKAGLALDCCGRQLYLSKDVPVELDLPPLRPPATGETPPRWERFLTVRFCETPVEYLPALYSDAACDELRREPSRVREGVTVELLDPHQVSERCWPRQEPKEPPESPVTVPATDPHHWDPVIPHPGADPAHSCTELRPHGRTPDCPDECLCDHYLVLARLTWSHDGGLVIDMRHRRVLPTPPGRLARIISINWPHGATLPIADLVANGGRLEVLFSRPIRPSTEPGAGVNANTFQVQFVQAQRALEFLDPSPASAPAVEGGYRAVFTIDPRYYSGANRNALINAMIWVTIRGDFIMDDQNNPVDVDFLRGQLPTGNGVPGGTFVSWFSIGP